MFQSFVWSSYFFSRMPTEENNTRLLLLCYLSFYRCFCMLICMYVCMSSTLYYFIKLVFHNFHLGRSNQRGIGIPQYVLKHPLPFHFSSLYHFWISEDNFLDQIYDSRYFRIIIMMILIPYKIIRKFLLTQQQNQTTIKWVPSCFLLYLFRYAFSSRI